MKAQATVKFDGSVHFAWHCIESHGGVVEPASFGDDGIYEALTKTVSLCGGANPEPLHFAKIIFQGTERDAAYRVGTVYREEQCAARWSVLAGKFGKLLIETLKTKIDVKPRCVFEEELAGGFNMGWCCRGNDVVHSAQILGPTERLK